MTVSILTAFSVRRREPEIIRPPMSSATRKELKPLSDIDDQKGLRYQIPFVMFYENNNKEHHHHHSLQRLDPVSAIREALGKALEYYYPLAGRLVEGPNEKLLVDCTGEGVLFIEADADVTLAELGDAILPPCPFIGEILYDVPGSGGIIGSPLLLFQVTRLLCGGFILAIRVNHAVMDAFGVAQFLRTIGEMVKGAPTAPSPAPIWRRELLTARSSPRITCTHHEFDELSKTGTESPLATMDSTGLAQQSFFFGPEEIKALREQLPLHLEKSSRFELVTACVWKCRTIAVDLDPNEDVRFACVVSARGKEEFQVPAEYYGNAFAYPATVSIAGEVCKNPLGYTVELVKQLKSKMSVEYIQSLADFMVIKGRPVYHTGWLYIVSDNTRAGLEAADLGWGRPILGGPSVCVPLISYYLKYRNAAGQDGIVVPMCLPQQAMRRFQEELQKMTRSVQQ